LSGPGFCGAGAPARAKPGHSIRGGDPHKLRLSTPYYLQKKDKDRFLEKFDDYRREKKLV